MSEYSMITEAQARATNKYRKKAYDQLNIRLRKDSGDKKKFQDYADSLDMTFAEFVAKSLHYVVDHNIRP